MSRAIRQFTALGLILSLSVAGAVSASSHTGTVTVIHGVPGLTVDVQVNGDLTLEGFEPGAITDPPSLAVFVNDVSTIAAGETRLTARHAGAAPAVDIWVGGAVIVESLANGQEASLDVPAASYNVAVSAAGDDQPVLGPADFDLGEGTSYIVDAIGSLADGNLDLLVQTISGLHDAPEMVPAGAGSTATEDSSALFLVLAAGFAAIVLTGSAVAWRRQLA